MEIIDKIITNLPLILSVGAAIGTGYAWVNGADGRNADTASTLTGTALNLVNELQEELNRMKIKVDGLQSQTEQQEVDRVRVEHKYDTLLIRFRDVEQLLFTVEQELVNVESERDTLTMKVTFLTEELQSLTQMNIDLMAQITKLQGDIRRFNNNNNKKDTDVL